MVDVYDARNIVLIFSEQKHPVIERTFKSIVVLPDHGSQMPFSKCFLSVKMQGCYQNNGLFFLPRIIGFSSS